MLLCSLVLSTNPCHKPKISVVKPNTSVVKPDNSIVKPNTSANTNVVSFKLNSPCTNFPPPLPKNLFRDTGKIPTC